MSPRSASYKLLASTTSLAVALLLSSCGLGSGSASGSGGGGHCNGYSAGSVDPKALHGVTVKVGSKEYDEQLILGQLTLAMMCAAGANAIDETNTKGSTQARDKLIHGGSDVYWDLTGTAYYSYLGHDKPIPDAEKLYEAVKTEDLAKHQLVWGQLAPWNNTYAFATTKEFAEKNNLRTHSDMAAYLAQHPDATVCMESEFAVRPDGYPGFSKAYGITGGKVKNLGIGVIYTQVDKGSCDFGEVFTTDGRLGALGLTVLQDDKAFFPLYNGAPVVTEATDKAHPEILQVLAPLAEKLTTEAMRAMNTRVSADGESPKVVAIDFLKKEGFIK